MSDADRPPYDPANPRTWCGAAVELRGPDGGTTGRVGQVVAVNGGCEQPLVVLLVGKPCSIDCRPDELMAVPK